MKKFEQFELNKIETDNFIMSPVELKDYIDFDVKRIYYITEPKKDTGEHCHKVEKELFILVQGTCTAVIDEGDGVKEYKMKAPQSAMYVDSYVWHHFKDFSEDAILLALSSTNYSPDRSDYIEDHDEFKKAVKEQV